MPHGNKAFINDNCIDTYVEGSKWVNMKDMNMYNVSVKEEKLNVEDTMEEQQEEEERKVMDVI